MRFNAKQLEDRRRGAQDQVQGVVAGLSFDSKLIHFSSNKKNTFPVPMHELSMVWLIYA
jgi:hypothetical protein